MGLGPDVSFENHLSLLLGWVIDGWNSLDPNESVTTLIHYTTYDERSPPHDGFSRSWWINAFGTCLPYV